MDDLRKMLDNEDGSPRNTLTYNEARKVAIRHAEAELRSFAEDVKAMAITDNAFGQEKGRSVSVGAINTALERRLGRKGEA